MAASARRAPGGVRPGERVEVPLERLEASSPPFRHAIQVAARHLDAVGLQRPAALTAPPLAPDQARPGEHAEMLGDRVPRHG